MALKQGTVVRLGTGPCASVRGVGVAPGGRTEAWRLGLLRRKQAARVLP
ncbi:hypothetical protein F383_37485 [Gossypium arboreum]|uniref:Uncharacterized protein n=1 Tax=Gossypium arboreum TaxID=29729 RepID=A0A0B0M871_GOSAR|nr:hypothetical protein F383_37485 [Gossypium arboreum]